MRKDEVGAPVHLVAPWHLSHERTGTPVVVEDRQPQQPVVPSKPAHGLTTFWFPRIDTQCLDNGLLSQHFSTSAAKDRALDQDLSGRTGPGVQKDN